jgi:hypothetical protein
MISQLALGFWKQKEVPFGVCDRVLFLLLLLADPDTQVIGRYQVSFLYSPAAGLGLEEGVVSGALSAQIKVIPGGK